jgi:pimeloyl-ACP methyl ester carboxylesterase
MRRLLKRLFLLWAAWRLLGPEPEPSFPSGQEHPNPLPGRTVFVGDRELFVREAGPVDAPPVLLLHGWGDHSLVVWHAVIPLLAERFRVIALDNRNTGKSDHVRGGYEIAGNADDAAGVLEALGIESAVVVGYSMGGMIAQEFARRHGDRVRGLVLAGTASTPIGTLGLPGLFVRLGMILLRAFGRVSRLEHTWLRTRILRDSGAVAPEHLRWFWTQHLNRDASLYWEAGFAITRFDSAEWIGGLTVPTTVVVNTADQLLDPAAQYQLIGRVANLHEVVEVLDARHEGPLTHPREYAGAIARLTEAVQ